MEELKAIQTVVKQLAIPVAIASVMVMKEADAGLTSGANTVNLASFNWNAPDKCIELLSLEMEVMNILQIMTYKLDEEKIVPLIKNWLGREELNLIHLQNLRKRHAKQQKSFVIIRVGCSLTNI